MFPLNVKIDDKLFVIEFFDASKFYSKEQFLVNANEVAEKTIASLNAKLDLLAEKNQQLSVANGNLEVIANACRLKEMDAIEAQSKKVQIEIDKMQAQDNVWWKGNWGA